MVDREKVLENFKNQKDFIDEKVNEGIEQYRKCKANINITDKEGNAVSNAQIEVIQNSHHFKFGANIFMLDELETEEKNELYKKHFKEVFNIATLPFYWDSTEPEKGKTRYDKESEKLYRRPPIDLCMEFCEKNNIEPREHALAYEHFFPSWLYDATVFEIKSALQKRFNEISERYAKKIPTIEVTNEMVWTQGKTRFYDEDDYVEWCFKLAEKYFPANELCINEFTEPFWGDKCRVTDKYFSYIEANMLKGARIDAIGGQFHMFFKKEEEYEKTRMYYDPQKLYAHMDLYSKFKKPLQVTEITIPSYSNSAQDEKIQAEIIEYLYSIWFSHPNVEQIMYWNIVDGYAHVIDPNPEKVRASQGNMTLGENYYYGGLLRFDMSVKPAYEMIKELITNRWNTKTQIKTDKNGTGCFKGFYGNYTLNITSNGKTIQRKISLHSKGKKTFDIQI